MNEREVFGLYLTVKLGDMMLVGNKDNLKKFVNVREFIIERKFNITPEDRKTIIEMIDEV